MLKERRKKIISRILVLVLALTLVFDYNLMSAYASNLTLPDNQYLVSQTENKIAPGINENQLISNSTSGNRQNMDYVCEVDLKNTSTTKIIAGYNNYDGSSWGMQTVRDQAKAAEKATGYNIVAAINADFFNMATGEPAGALVMNGKIYHKASGEPYFAILKDGTATIRESSVSLDDVQEAVGGGPILVKDGKALDFGGSGAYGTSVNPRTVIGIKPDGTVVTLVNDGRNAPISYGRSFQELADIMESLGCETALNLDGGGSTTFLSKPEGSDKLICRNNPSDGTERTVSSSLFIVSTAKPTGEFDHATISPNNLVYTPNSKVEFTATGVDSSGASVTLPEGLTWTLEDSSYGEIDSNGVFTANDKTGEVKVNLKNGDEIVGTTTITIATPDSITFNNEEVSLGFAKESDLGIIVKYKGRDINYKDGDFKWTLSDERLGSFKGNTFISSDSESLNGTATVTSAYDDSVTATVNLVIGKLPSVIWDFEDKTDETTGETILAEDYYSITDDPSNPDSLLYVMGYGRGGKRDAKIIDIDSNEPVRFGSNALRIDYDFTEATGTEGACIGYNRAGDPVEGNPTAVGMWVYAPEGTPNLWLRMYVNDGDGNNQVVNFTEEAKISEGKMGGIDWTGWRYVEASLEGKKGPFKLRKGETIRVMYVPGTKMGCYTKGATKDDGTYEMEYIPQAQRKGSIYIDNLQFVYGANNDDIDNPQVDSITANDVEIKDGMTIDTNTITFKSIYSDVENKNTSGIDYDTVRMYIDGVNMSSESNYVNVTGDNMANLYDAKLSNGTHTVKVSLRDKFGNETTETRTFVVNGTEEFNTVKLAPTTEGNPILNKTFDLGLTADKIEEINEVETEVKIHKDFSDYEVKFNDDFDGTATYDAKNSLIKIKATRKEGVSTQTGKQNIATITFKISKDLKKGSVFTYAAQKGAITYNVEQAEGYTKSFATAQEKLEVVAPLTVKVDQMVVGFDGKIYVTDLDGKPVSEAVIYRDGTEIGTTNEEGYLQTDILCQTEGKCSVYAAKGEDLSYAVTVQTTSAAGNEDGLPEYVVSNATTGSATSKNITWMSNPKSSEAKAIMQIATKADYDKNGQAAFKNVEGTSKLQSFLGSSDATLNKSVRVNKVLATGLTRNTEYAYRVGDGKQWSEVKTFKTNRAGTNTNFFVIGDTQVSNKDNVDKIAANLAKDGNYSFGIQTGDSVDNASIYSHWTDVLQLFGGNYISGVDMIHVLGNHEFMSDEEGDAAQNIYNLPNSRRYSVEYGNVYVATISYTVDKNQLKEDLEWLKEDAKASKCKWKVLTMHQPAYYTNDVGSNEMINELVPPVVDELGIDFVFAGHDHSYARTEPLKDRQVDEENGAVYYICGSTGEKSYSITNNPDFHFAMATQDYTGIYLTVSTTDDKMTVVTHDVDGSIIDSYTKTKVAETCKDGHDYVYDGSYLTCKDCGYSRELGDYTGFATDEKTGKTMYFISGEFKTGWFTYGSDQIYYFDKNGLEDDLEIIEDVPTTCTERGYKTVRNRYGTEKTIKYSVPIGHTYEKVIIGENDSKYICSVCGHEGKDISLCKVDVAEKVPYTGSKRLPEVTIEGLTKNVDYTISYSNNINPGIAKIIINGKGEYVGTINKFFIIYRGINSLESTLEYNECDYDGTEKKPSVTIEGLTENADYKVSYSNNVNAGTATVLITGITDFYTGTAKKTFTINPKSITDLNATLEYNECGCDGTEKKPSVTIEGLTENVDYKVSYSDNINPGTATVLITGINGYTGTIKKVFTIIDDRIDISNYDVKIADKSSYTGSERKPTVTIEGLTKGTDYTVTYTDNVNPGTAKVVIKGIGKYKGEITKTFIIYRSISKLEVELSYTECNYDGTAKEPKVTLQGLTEGTDYSVSYKNNVNVGEATVTIKGIEPYYTGTLTKIFTINKGDINDLDIKLSYTSCDYDGNEKKPEVTIEGLTEGKDYVVSYENNLEPGEATVKITGIGSYTGTVEKTFKIEGEVNPDRIDISEYEAKLEKEEYAYTGEEVKPKVVIEGLTEGTDYKVSYLNNINIGEGTIKILGIGNYKGTIEKTFVIKKVNISTCKITMAEKSAYSGSQRKPIVTVEGLIKGLDYTVSYSDNINPGIAKAVIKGIGKYEGEVTKTFIIYRSISKLEAELSYTECNYDGTSKEPKVTLQGLIEGTDYSVSYKNNVNVGEATVTIKGIDPYYTGTLTKTFTINKSSIHDLDIKLSYTSCDYDGNEKKPEVTLEGLTEGKDYVVSYENNLEPGEATVKITGIGNYTGTVEKTFKIEGEVNPDRIDISEYEAKLEKEEYAYTGEEVKPKVVIEGLTEGTDYKVSYLNNINIGEGTIKILGIGNYKGTIVKTFTIKEFKIDISTCKITMAEKSAYSGSQRKPAVTIEGLKKGTDYTVTYTNNINPGIAKAIIKGIGKYEGEVTKTFIIYRSISKMEATLSYTECNYDGTAKEPKVTIEGLTEGKDYSVSYTNNVNVGIATVTIKGIAPYYTGTITKTFTIDEQNISTLSLKLEADNLDTANKQTLEIADLEEGQDYIVTYDLGEDSNTINIEGIGNYEGQKILKASKDTEMIVEEDGVQYNLLSNGYAEVYNFTESGKKANIKSTVKDHKVTKISKNAFKKCDKLKLVKIPKSVSEIAKDAFKDCKNITISGKLDSYASTYADENKINFKESK